MIDDNQTNQTPTDMTNFERNMKNSTQRKNFKTLTDSLKAENIQYEVQTMKDHKFISIFYILDYEFVINPNGTMDAMNLNGSDFEEEEFETVEDMFSFIQTQLN